MGPRWERQAFSLDGQSFTWGFVRDQSARHSVWLDLERRVRGASAVVRGHTAHDGAQRPDAVDEAVVALRERHRLFAAEDFESWMYGRDLTLAEVVGWMRVDISAAAVTTGNGPRSDEATFGAMLWTAAVCTGVLPRVGRDVAAQLCCERSLAERNFECTGGDILTTYGEMVCEVSRLERLISARLVDWTVVAASWVVFPTESVAREARLCADDDARSLACVATDLGFEAVHRVLLAEDVPPTARAAIRSARVGEIVGPFRDTDGFLLVSITSKRAPSLSIEQVEARARCVAIEAAINDELEARVTWIDPL